MLISPFIPQGRVENYGDNTISYIMALPVLVAVRGSIGTAWGLRYDSKRLNFTFKKTMTTYPGQDCLSRSMIQLCWAVLCVVLGLYLWNLYGLVYDADLAILTSFAQRMLEGHKFADMYYETNPPLSILIYVPVLWIQSLSGLEIYHAHFFYSLGLSFIFFVLTAYLLARIEGIDRASWHLFLMGFAVTQIIVPGHDFGDRDHLVLMALFPFVLGQIALYQQVETSRVILWGAFIIGTVFILVKPHYGLIPTFCIGYRFFKGAYFRVIKAPDFIALAFGVLIYGLVLVVFFRDFLEIVLFDSIILYGGSRNPNVWADIFICASFLVIFLPVLNTAQILGEREKRIINFLALITALLFIPYLVQGKALNYHRIPYLSLWYITGMGASFYVLRHYVRSRIALGFVIVCFISGISILQGIPKGSLTHEEYKSLPLSRALKQYCPQERTCRFLLLTDTADNIHRLSVYHNAFHASRFTSMWYLPPLIMPKEFRRLSDADIKIYKSKYIAMVADDMVRFQPDVIIVLQNLMGYPDFDFIDFYAADPRFAEEFKSYDLEETLSFDRRIYFPGLSTKLDKAPQGQYMVYTRKP